MTPPAICVTEGCGSREFTRREMGSYVGVTTLLADGTTRWIEEFTELDSASPWVCEGGHEQPDTILGSQGVMGYG